MLPTVAQAVRNARGLKVFDVGIHGAHELPGAGGRAIGGAVQSIPKGASPNQRVEGLSLLPIRVESIAEPRNIAFTPPQIDIDPGLGIRTPAVHGKRLVVHACGVKGDPEAVLEDFRAFVPIVPENVAANHHVPTAHPLTVKEPEVALLQGPAPILAGIRASRVAVDAMLQTHPC